VLQTLGVRALLVALTCCSSVHHGGTTTTTSQHAEMPGRSLQPHSTTPHEATRCSFYRCRVHSTLLRTAPDCQRAIVRRSRRGGLPQSRATRSVTTCAWRWHTRDTMRICRVACVVHPAFQPLPPHDFVRCRLCRGIEKISYKRGLHPRGNS